MELCPLSEEISVFEKLSVEHHLHALMCSVSVVFIHMMEDDQRLNTLVYEGDVYSMLQHCKKRANLCMSKGTFTPYA